MSFGGAEGPFFTFRQSQARCFVSSSERKIRVLLKLTFKFSPLVSLFTSQAEVYKEDFLKERRDREKLKEQYLELETKFKKVHSGLRVLKPQVQHTVWRSCAYFSLWSHALNTERRRKDLNMASLFSQSTRSRPPQPVVECTCTNQAKCPDPNNQPEIKLQRRHALDNKQWEASSPPVRSCMLHFMEVYGWTPRVDEAEQHPGNKRCSSSVGRELWWDEKDLDCKYFPSGEKQQRVI